MLQVSSWQTVVVKRSLGLVMVATITIVSPSMVVKVEETTRVRGLRLTKLGGAVAVLLLGRLVIVIELLILCDRCLLSWVQNIAITLACYVLSVRQMSLLLKIGAWVSASPFCLG